MIIWLQDDYDMTSLLFVTIRTKARLHHCNDIILKLIKYNIIL